MIAFLAYSSPTIFVTGRKESVASPLSLARRGHGNINIGHSVAILTSWPSTTVIKPLISLLLSTIRWTCLKFKPSTLRRFTSDEKELNSRETLGLWSCLQEGFTSIAHTGMRLLRIRDFVHTWKLNVQGSENVSKTRPISLVNHSWFLWSFVLCSLKTFIKKSKNQS